MIPLRDNIPSERVPVVTLDQMNLPALHFLKVDVEGMEIGAAVHAGDLDLPSGVTLTADPESLVLHVIAAPTAEQMEAELGLPEAEEAAEVPPEAPLPEGEAPAEPAASGEEQSG